MQYMLYADYEHYDWERQRLIQYQCGDTLHDSNVFRQMLLDDTDERRSPVATAIMGEISEYDWQTQKHSLPQDEKKLSLIHISEPTRPY